ncbi:MAG TPA: glutamyl-tRNA reductase [Jatrophihabitans sp.]
MSVLVVGLSHRTAPVSLLEKVSVGADELRKTLDELNSAETVSEVLLLSTCNRIEVYADVARFHPAVVDVSTVLARHAGIDVTGLAGHLYVHFAEAAAEHMLSVASGLDSMVIGESQILGQLRSAYNLGTDAGSVGGVLHELAQTALRVGKRVHTDTGIDRAGASVVSVALDHAAALFSGSADMVHETPSGDLSGKRALIIGAGSMGALAGATLRRRGVTDIVVANRSLDRAERLASTLEGRAVSLAAIREEIAAADIVVSSTGATGLVVDSEDVAARPGSALAVLDLALPRDVSPAVGDLEGVTYIDLEALRGEGPIISDAEVSAANGIVAEELSTYLTAQQRLAVAPTVTALRARANQVVESELARLDGRLPGLEPEIRSEVADAVRRAVDKLLHAPTVRVKELAGEPGGDQYAAALRELFGLDPATAESVAAVKTTPTIGTVGGA